VRTHVGTVGVGVDDHDSRLVKTTTTSATGHLSAAKWANKLSLLSKTERWGERKETYYSPGSKSRKLRPSCLRMLLKTTHFAGMLTPCVRRECKREGEREREKEEKGTDHGESLGSVENLDETAREEKLNNLHVATMVSEEEDSGGKGEGHASLTMGRRPPW
jgi:hypothetical protein